MNAGLAIKQMRLYRDISVSKLSSSLNISEEDYLAIENAEDCNISVIQKIAGLLSFEFILFPKEEVEKQELNILLD